MKKKIKDKELIFNDYKNGKTMRQIAKENNITYTRVYQIVNNMDSNSNFSKNTSITINKSRVEAINILGGKCRNCGFDDFRALQIDHVYGDGSLDRKNFIGYKLYLRIINEPECRHNYQILCANCNWIKRHENKEVRNRTSYISYEKDTK